MRFPFQSRLKTFFTVCVAALAMVFGATGGARAAATGEFAAARDGRELAARLRDLRPLPEAMGTLTTRSADGVRTAQEVRLKVVELGPNRWSTVYESMPGGKEPGKHGERLELIREAGLALKYLHSSARNVNETEPVKSVELGGSKAAVPFARTDFWLSDLGMEFLSWPEQRVLRHEMRKSRSCKVLESINTSQEGEDYARVVSWVDIETGNLLRAEAYDTQGKRRKEFTVSKVGKSQGRWQVREIRIYDYKSDSSTTLQFELDVPEP